MQCGNMRNRVMHLFLTRYNLELFIYSSSSKTKYLTNLSIKYLAHFSIHKFHKFCLISTAKMLALVPILDLVQKDFSAHILKMLFLLN